MANRIKVWPGTPEVFTAADLNAEFNNIYEGTIIRTGGSWGFGNNIPLALGGSDNSHVVWNTAQTVDSLMIGVGAGNIFHLVRKGDLATNFAFPSQSNPTFVIQSGSATANRFLSLQHDQTNARINSGTGNILLQTAGSTRATVSATGLSASDIGGGTLAVARGGTGLSSYTTNNYIKATGATTLAQRTPANVWADVLLGGAARTDIEARVTNFQNLGDPSRDVIEFATEVSDPTNEFNNTLYEFAAANAGLYLIIIYAQFSGATARDVELRLRRNRSASHTTIREEIHQHVSSSLNASSYTLPVPVVAQAGDIFYADVQATGGLTLVGGAGATTFRAVRLH